MAVKRYATSIMMYRMTEQEMQDLKAAALSESRTVQNFLRMYVGLAVRRALARTKDREARES